LPVVESTVFMAIILNIGAISVEVRKKEDRKEKQGYHGKLLIKMLVKTMAKEG
jgi:hypothetical protein